MAANARIPRVGALTVRVWKGWRGLDPRAAVLLLVILGVVLRLLRLDGLGDFDFDEVAAIWYARSAPGDIVAAIAAAPFEHPPLFYVALHYWTSWFGESEAIARAISVPLGVLLIPVTYRLARIHLPPWPAVFAAGVIAVAPLAVFYSREARMYAAATLLAVVALVLFEQAMRRGRRRDWIGLAAAIVAGVYVDFTVALAVAAMNLVLPLHWRRHRRRVLGFLGVELLGVAAVLPWVLLSRGLHDSLPAFGTGQLSGALVGDVAARTWLDLFVGLEEVRGGRAAPTAAALMGVLVVAGLVAAAVRRRAALMLAMLAASVAFLALLLLFDKPYQPRYVLPALPAAAVLSAVPFAHLPRVRWASALALGVAVLALAGPVYASRAYYSDYKRGDYRAITTTIEELARPHQPGRAGGKFRDAVVLAGPWQGWYWRHYFPNSLDRVDVWFLPDEVPPAVTPQEVEAKLGRASTNHRRLWVVLAGLEQADPHYLVESWLSTHLWQARSEVYRNGVLQLYLTNELDLVDRKGQVRIAGGFESKLIQFAGYRADQGPREAGDGVRFNLFLSTTRAVAYDVRIRVWLRGPDGIVYAKDLFAHDDSLRRTSQWTPGEEHLIRTAVWIPAEAVPGQYDAYVAFIDPDDRGLEVRGSLAGFRYPSVNYMWLGPVRITRPSIALGSEAELRARVGSPIR